MSSKIMYLGLYILIDAQMCGGRQPHKFLIRISCFRYSFTYIEDIKHLKLAMYASMHDVKLYIGYSPTKGNLN